MVHAKVSKEIYDIVSKVSAHCPKLWALLMKGTEQGKFNERLYQPYETKIFKDTVLRFWRYADFELDYMLAQQFNYEYQILHAADANNCKHIVNLHNEYLNIDSVVFMLERYDMDLRTYLRKHRDSRELPRLLL